MTETTAKIRAKGLDSTGVTEDIASEMYTARGRHYMAIVEVRVDETHLKADGTRKVDLILTQVEPATTDELADHLRELTRTLHYNRGLDGHFGTVTGEDGIEPKVSDVLAAGQKHRPHPFLPVDAADDNGICDVCGGIASAGVHSTQDFLPDGDDEDEPCDDCGWVGDEHADECTLVDTPEAEHEVLDQPNDPENPDEPALDVAGDDEHEDLAHQHPDEDEEDEEPRRLTAVGDPFTP